ncbi:sigma-54 dependent transcriptional regulator [uncultured Psychrosphaera sp.]|uniref:sigma-54-dependent transcriptional regulator n=1 Tax=uncultured Psychrosphaera sp. TaxID=1403522 RepID=UPI00261CDF62|nr:sigma-54 dependent transcriptional regulator [uncultured Psychrosphaera sp.]
MKQKTILVVDDDEDIRLALAVMFTQHGYKVLEAKDPTQCLLMVERKKPDLILLDMNYSRDTTSGAEGIELLSKLIQFNVPVILMTAWANIELAVNGIQMGASDFIEKPWNKNALLSKVGQYCNKPHSQASKTDSWITSSKSMLELENEIQQLAPTDANILILGENGTGKSMLAKRLHDLSGRSNQPFLPLNMGAIAETLFESELFGHEKGAFTDAKSNRDGAFLRADQGTLFLDEIGTLPIQLQPKLLHVLESGEFTPLGASTSCKVNVRLIAATNQDLDEAIKNGLFRQDLLYRLNTFVITLPPLRDRADDIEKLAKQFIQKMATKYNRSTNHISPEALSVLKGYSWPGNIRELSHVIERAVLINSGTNIHSSHLNLDLTGKTKVQFGLQADLKQSEPQHTEQTLEEMEIQRINKALKANNGQISAAATDLGISRNALYRRLEKYQLA